MAMKILDRIEVKSPCNESWDKMAGNDTVRFCSHCARDVHNLSAISALEAEELIQGSQGRLCVRYVKTPGGKLLSGPARKPVSIGRRGALAAGVLAASISISSVAYAQGEANVSVKERPVAEKSAAENIVHLATLSGLVSDQNGAVVPGITITLLNTGDKETRRKVTNSEGHFNFTGLKPGRYEITLEGRGFEKLVLDNFEISGETGIHKNLEIKASGEVVGLLGLPDYPTLDSEASVVGPDSINWPKPGDAGKNEKESLPQNSPKQKSNSASLFGEILDKNGALIIGAKITLQNTLSSLKYEAKTNDEGNYSLEGLEPGIYDVSIEAFGFEKLKIKRIEILDDARINKSFSLEVAVMGELVVITADPLQKPAH